ncbi:SRPBCC family protein [Actinokineospora sp.]|uniref:SRPBCC family protein n=1 Tax=Actinokineospora sp. TaxID=1872133 RepID=UPI003D6BB885
MTIVSDRVEHEIHIKAPPETVFAYFTDAERHPRWMGVEATLDPRPGGVYRCVVHDKATVLGEYVLVEPPHKVVFTWGFEGNEDVPPGSSTVTVTLTPDDTGTLLRLVHTGLPHPSLASHDRGWTTYLHNLSDAE